MPLSKDIEDPLFECLNLDSKASALPTAQFNKYNVESKQNHAMQSVYKLDYDQKLTSWVLINLWFYVPIWWPIKIILLISSFIADIDELFKIRFSS